MQISILWADGVPPDELLDAVRKQVTRDDIRVLTDTVEVIACRIIPVNIYAKISINPMASQDIIETTKKQFIEKFESAKGLGWNITKSWVIANLFMEGMQNIELIEPSENVVIGGNECAALGDIKIEGV